MKKFAFLNLFVSLLIYCVGDQLSGRKYLFGPLLFEINLSTASYMNGIYRINIVLQKFHKN